MGLGPDQVRAAMGMWLPEEPDEPSPAITRSACTPGWWSGSRAGRDPADPSVDSERAGAGRDRRHPGPPHPRRDRVRLLRRTVSTSDPDASAPRPRARGRAAARARHPDGWQTALVAPPTSRAEGQCNDATLGTASVLLGALWALRYDVPGAAELAAHAADLLMAEGEAREGGAYWPFVPLRFLTGEDVEMPNWSHGQAGIAAALAVAGGALTGPTWSRPPRGPNTCSPWPTPVTAASGCLTGSPDSRIWTRSPTPGATGRQGPPCCSRPWIAPTFPCRRRRRTTGARLPALAACLRRPRSAPSRILGQRRALLRDGGCGRRHPQVWQRRARRRPRVRHHPGRRLVDRAIEDGTAYWRFIEHRNPSHCCRRARAGCRVPPGSRPTSSDWRDSSSGAVRPPSGAWTPGGRCRLRPPAQDPSSGRG